MSLRALVFATALICASTMSHAIELEGIRFEPATRVATAPLQLNGAGIRSRYLIKIYAVGLYLGASANSLDDAMAAPGAKRIEIVPFLDFSATQFNEPLIKGMKKNLPPAEFEAMQPRIKAFSEKLLAINEVKKGSRIALDWIPGRGTRVMIDGHETGASIAGEDFFRGLLAIWIGSRPTQDDLKSNLLASKPATD